ncbi:purine-cytosine permease family protein [Marinobacterium mangrovicola]|uniref:NCS1 nucleoside transporter family n=1 Tax=Marinobacterium mangrovicola TaxID=1476959 RepID=A0A4R1G7K7_9GAMM|nr:cytosine permease [Marinobacterium mangrovicola]TCK04067.1 NCS1 nucleoside transporter family [Marinobacterium mangrovicola]
MEIHSGHDTILPTSAEDRNLGLLGTIFLWTAATLVTPTIMTGQMFIPDVTPYSAFMTVLIGSILGCIALASVAIIGTKTGLPTFVIARSTYGYHGSKIFAALNVVILAGWSLIQGYLGAMALNKVTSLVFGLDNIVLCIFITQGLVMVITILGHSGIQKIEGVASSLMLIMALSVTYKLLSEHGLTEVKNLPLSDTPSLTLAIVFDIVLATAFSWITLPCDYNRYCKSKKVSGIGIVSGYMLGTIIAMGLGILVGAFSIIGGHTPTYDPADIMQGKYVALGSLVMFLSVVTTNIMSLYSVSMSSMSVLPKLRFPVAVLFWGVLIILGTLLQEMLLASFLDWVLLVGALMIPVFAIIITDYYLINNRTLNDSSVNYSSVNKKAGQGLDFNFIALITYVLSAVFAIYFTYSAPLEIGSTALTFVFAATVYFVLTKLFGARNSQNLSTAQL